MKGKLPLLSAIILALLTLPVSAETLFEDLFGSVLSAQAATEDINLDLARRQRGPLAPSPYAKGGKPWQIQVLPSGGVMVAMMFGADDWVGISPGWELSQEDGAYSITFEFEFAKDGYGPDEVILVLGRAETKPGELGGFDLNNTFAVVLEEDPGKPVRAYSPEGWSSSEDIVISDPLRRSLTVKWQQAGGKIFDRKILVDGHETKAESNEAMTLPVNRVMIGSRMGSHLPEGFSVLELERLEYTKE